MKNTHLLCLPYPSSLRRMPKHSEFLRISGTLHPGIFKQPGQPTFSAICEVKGRAMKAPFHGNYPAIEPALIQSWQMRKPEMKQEESTL
jgi:hypothetical protein